MRGFDIFMQAAKLIYERDPDVLFVVVGTDRVAYGGDEASSKRFREHVLASETMTCPGSSSPAGPTTLVELLSLTDLHIYLTVPFVLSWSLLDALACGARCWPRARRRCAR